MVEAADGGGDDVADDGQFADGQIGFVELAVSYFVQDKLVHEFADFGVFDMVPLLEFRAGGGFADVRDFDDHGFLSSWKRAVV